MNRRVYPVAAVAAVALVLVVWVSSSRPVHVWHAARPATQPTPTQTQPTGSSTTQSLTDLPHHKALPFGILTVGMIVIGALTVALLAFLVAAYLVRKRRERRRGSKATHLDAASALDAFDVPDRLRETAEAQLRALRTGSPRNAIVECWLRLEEAVAEAGLDVPPAETSMELTERVLSSYVVDDRSIRDLARLYREARFSEHRLGEEHRESAVSALQRLHADFQRGQRTQAAATAEPPT
ncbi:MAG: DUF4129 domain-containing protein [Nocardioidaceae bacterium]